ncbi:MAG: ThiF family adenylyltransferase [Bacteroidia bacterium]
MYSFSDARKEAFSKLSAHEKLKVVDQNRLDKKFGAFSEVWEIIKEVTDSKGIGKELTFYICLRNSFPLSLPTLYLSKESYNAIKYVPHIDSNLLICTFDNETTRTDPTNPYGIILTCLHRARLIIESGLKRENLKDYEEEFLSYWECQYDEKAKVNQNVLSLIEQDPVKSSVRLLRLDKKLGYYTDILYQESEENARFLKYLEETGCKFTDGEVFYAGELEIESVPPFDITNRKAIEKIKTLPEKSFNEFVKKINKSNRLLVLFKRVIRGKSHYLGWFHSSPMLMQRGFRPNKLTAIEVLSRMAQSAEKVTRISPEEYTMERISKRTAGVERLPQYKFLVAGIGSIGSNLLYFLNALSYPELRLIDYGTLTIENIGRHLLGVNYLHMNKTEATKDYLRCINPKQNILTKELSLTEVFERDPTFITDADHLFIVTGKLNVETWIAEMIKAGAINKPTFILWVEPYLAGGHCIYIHPKNFKYTEFYHSFEERQFFNGNIIHDKEHIDKGGLLTLKEAGCQTSYIPYSGTNVILFLSALYPRITKLISGASDKSFCISWVGDKDMLDKLGLELSEFGKKHNSFELIEYGL